MPDMAQQQAVCLSSMAGLCPTLSASCDVRAALLVDFPFRARLMLLDGSSGESSHANTQGDHQPVSELLAVTWDVADLLAHSAARCAAIRAGQPGPLSAQQQQQQHASTAAAAADFPAALCGPGDVAALVAPLQAQDHDPMFRRVLADNQNVHAIAQVGGGSAAAG